MDNSNLYINYKQENPIYSPGIGSYSFTGEKGEKGDSGNGIYYYPSSLSNNAQAKSFVEDKLNNNKLLYSLYGNDNPHEYLENDSIIDSDGNVYIIKGTPGSFTISECVGNICPSCPLCVDVSIVNNNAFKLVTTANYDSSTIRNYYVFNVTYYRQINNTGSYVTSYNYSIGNTVNFWNKSQDSNIYVEICSKTTGICSKYILTVS